MDITAQIDFLRASLQKKPLVLVGLMGAGKTTIGESLGKKLDLPYVDADDEIVKKAGCSISQIFEEQGEPAFRLLEKETLQELMTRPGIIGTGGGAFIQDETRKTILEHGLSLFLKSDLETLVDRVGDGKGRPLLEGKNIPVIMGDLIRVRYPFYEQADVTVETSSESEEETVQSAISVLYTHLQP